MIDERNKERDAKVLDAAYHLLRTKGLSAFTRDAVAEAAGVSPASVSNFGRTRITNGTHRDGKYRPRLMRAVMDRAWQTDDRLVLMMGVAEGIIRPDEVA
jgi:AcrR family transcriptional regulator